MLASIYPMLTELKTKLTAVDGVATCKIGLEQGIAHEDYPIVRIVPQDIAEGDSYTRRKANVLVYFGMPIDESTDGLESVYSQLLTMEAAIVAASKIFGDGWRSKYLSTITDEDRVEVYKLMAVRLEIEG